jgi:hypothetical protein
MAITPRLLLKPTRETTRLLLTVAGDEMLRAVLPAPPTAHARAAPVLLEGLALWLQRPLSVALCAEDGELTSALGLSDGFGFGKKTVHYEVEVVDPSRRRRGLGSFRDLRQIALRGVR